MHHSPVTSSTTPGDAALPDFDPAVIVELDLREDLHGGGPPLPRILAAAKQVGPGGVLHLRTTFLPEPLFAVLNQQGFLHQTQSFAEDDWSSWFWRSETPPEARASRPTPPPSAPAAGALDLRLLPPPEPLLVILDRIGGNEEPFEVLLPFNPDLLHNLLAEQGWQATVVEEGTDGVRLRIEQDIG